MGRRVRGGVPRRVERHRWLRSDGTPNFDDRIYRKREELEIIARKPVVTVSPSTPLLEAAEMMAKGYRSLLVSTAGLLEGLLVAMDLVNYLGGGEYFKAVEERHGYNIYSALEKESVERIMNPEPIVAYIDEKLSDLLVKMVEHGIGVLPVITRDKKIYGIVTEKDILEYLSYAVQIGVKIRDIMTSPVITINADATLRDAMETMVRHGFRRLPVVKDGIVYGIVSAMDIVRFFGTHEAFRHTVTGDIREILRVPVDAVMRREIATVRPDDDAEAAARIMAEKNIGSVLVTTPSNELLGIVTERDILYAVVVPK